MKDKKIIFRSLFQNVRIKFNKEEIKLTLLIDKPLQDFLLEL